MDAELALCDDARATARVLRNVLGQVRGLSETEGPDTPRSLSSASPKAGQSLPLATLRSELRDALEEEMSRMLKDLAVRSPTGSAAFGSLSGSLEDFGRPVVEKQLEAARDQVLQLKRRLSDAMWLASTSKVAEENARLRSEATHLTEVAWSERQRAEGFAAELDAAEERARALEMEVEEARLLRDAAYEDRELLREELVKAKEREGAMAVLAAAAEVLAEDESQRASDLSRELEQFREMHRQKLLELENLQVDLERRGPSVRASSTGTGDDAWSELMALRKEAQGLMKELHSAEATAQATQAPQTAAKVHSRADVELPAFGSPSWRADEAAPADPVGSALQASLTAVTGLQSHASSLGKLFEEQRPPTGELLIRTWSYVRAIAAANEQWALAREALHAPELPEGALAATGGWAELVARASGTEAQVLALAASWESNAAR